MGNSPSTMAADGLPQCPCFPNNAGIFLKGDGPGLDVSMNREMIPW
jgi:hypothetical protein